MRKANAKLGQIHELVLFKIKTLSGKGKRKVRLEEKTGDEICRKTGKWVGLRRTIDRDKDLYFEEVTEPITGKVIHRCEEPLSRHVGHGSDKLKKKDK